jgi:hypothetical protein
MSAPERIHGWLDTQLSEVGSTSACLYCWEYFTLTAPNLWVPDWQLEAK